MILLFFAAWESDLFGYERRVPDPAEVESVSLRFLTLDEPENIEAVCELQRDIITHKAAHESAGEGQYYEIVYHLRDGSTLLRNYRLAVTREAMLEADSDFRRMSALFNCREAIWERTLGDFPYEDMLIAGGAISWQTEEGYQHLSLSSDEAQKLFFGALLPDLEAARIGQQYFFYETPEQYTDATNVTVEILGMPLDRNDTDRQYYLSLTVQTYSEKTVAALREDYAIDPVPYGTIYPPDGYSLLADAIVFD